MASKGNKHPGKSKRGYKKDWFGSKHWLEALEAKKRDHRKKGEKKDKRMKY